jgi:hypothetical protein
MIQHGAFMGLTMRTADYRYTEWLLFEQNLNNDKPPVPRFAPGFNASEPHNPGLSMAELYNHVGDDGELVRLDHVSLLVYSIMHMHIHYTALHLSQTFYVR